VASIYVHFPYCLEKCPYCDFVSYKTPEDRVPHEAYADAILREADRKPYAGRTVSSIFFGGGTPSLWRDDALARVLLGLQARYALTADAEVTIECNPTSLTASKLAAYAQMGVTRVSIGVQSLQKSELAYLGREHSKEGALQALNAALHSPVQRVSGDLIFGLPEQRVEQGSEHALALADLGICHISAYQLTIEPGTRFGELARAGRLPLAEDARVAEAFLLVSDALRARGFRHYEISNYAKPGHESRHNLAYWHGDEYLGLGCGAYEFTRHGHGAGGVRTRNAIAPERYLADAPPLSAEELTAEDLMKERIMLGLRLADGFDIEHAAQDLGVPALPDHRARALAQLEKRGRVNVDNTRITIPTREWLFADDTAARLF
jgi:putative oxygen-independent coproporphyrinogen III oxidase